MVAQILNTDDLSSSVAQLGLVVLTVVIVKTLVAEQLLLIHGVVWLTLPELWSYPTVCRWCERHHVWVWKVTSTLMPRNRALLCKKGFVIFCSKAESILIRRHRVRGRACVIFVFQQHFWRDFFRFGQLFYLCFSVTVSYTWWQCCLLGVCRQLLKHFPAPQVVYTCF